MAFDFDALKPEAKRAAFAHMRLGSGGRHKRLSSKKKGAVEHGGKGSVSGKLTSPGSGSVKGKLTPADHEKGSMGGKLPVAKARPRATAKPSAPTKPDTPEGRFDQALTEDVTKLTKGKNWGYAGMVDLRKSLDARGLSRQEQDTHLKRMSREGKIHIVPEDNRKALTQADHDAAIHIGGEPNHLVSFPGANEGPAAAPKPLLSTDPKKLAASRTPEDHADLAQKYLEMHGSDGVAFQIKTLERRQKAGKLGPGQRAQLAALKSLGKK